MRIFALMALLCTWGLATGGKGLAPPEKSLHFSLMDLDVKVHPLDCQGPGEIRVFVFLSTECPIANGNIPTLNQLHRELGRTGTAKLFGVVSDPFTTRGEAARHYRDYQTRFPILFDSSRQLCEQFQPSHVPEAFVVDATGRLAYRGAIDNAWEAVGKRRQVVTSHYLAEALERLRTNQSPNPARTQPVGCPVEYPPLDSPERVVTYHRDIAPVLLFRCAECHREKGTAFDLSGLEQAKLQGKRIATTPCKGPTAATRQCTPFEKSLLQVWLDRGMPPGDTADSPGKAR